MKTAKHVLTLVAAGLFVGSAFSQTATASRNVAGRPNILLILTDDQGFADVGAHGHPVLKTPNMDRLANEGLRFTQFQASGECAPTRASLMTGRNHMKAGITCTFLGKYYLPEGIPIMPELLRQAGYQTAIIGKWHLGEHLPSRPEDRGFEYSFIGQSGTLAGLQGVPWKQSYFNPTFVKNGKPLATQGFGTDLQFDEVLRWMKTERDANKPFFLYLPTFAPHGPYTPPKEAMQRFLDMGFGRDASGFYGLTENLDQNLGRLLKFMDETGISTNTLVIFMGDNGTSVSHMRHQDDAKPLWNAGLKGGKSQGDEGGTRVPCFIRWPGKIQPGRVSFELAAHYDLLPTLLEIAGAKHPAPQSLEGISLREHLLRPGRALPDRVIYNASHLSLPPSRDWEGLDYQNRISARTKEYRLWQGRLVAAHEDPGATVNLAAERPEMVKQLQDGISRFWQASTNQALTPVHIHLGDPREPTVMLASADWRPLHAGKDSGVEEYAHLMGQGISQEMLDWQNTGRAPKALAERKDRLNGFWNVFFTRPGTYEFHASIVPPEVRDMVHLKEGKVWLKVDGKTVCEAPVKAGSHEAVLRWAVAKPFRGELQVVWSGQLPFESELGAFICDVQRIEPPSHDLKP
jgi:arylsulfatase